MEDEDSGENSVVPGARARVSLALQIGREFINGTELPFFLLLFNRSEVERGKKERRESGACFGLGFNYGSDFVFNLVLNIYGSTFGFR